MGSNGCLFSDGNECVILTAKKCGGCKFYKTILQFEEAREKSILKCREQGLCDNCKYVRYPCRLGKGGDEL